MKDETLLGITVLNPGGTTAVPRRVREALKLEPTLHERVKLLWTQEGEEVVVTKGTPQSSFRKTMLRRDERAAVPKHIMELLKLKPTPHYEERMIWIQKREEVVVRRGAANLIPTD